MAQMGRNGDSVMAHMQPGEIAIPRQVQTPQLMALLQRAFAQAGLSPQQFTAGSPNASRNPATGAPEFNILSALLPILGAVGGGYVGGPAGAAIGGGLGGAASGYMNGDNTAGVLLSGAGGAAGGYLGAPTAGGAAAGAAGAGAGDAAASGATMDALGSNVGGGAAQNLPQYASNGILNPPPDPTVTPGGVAGSTTNANPFAVGSGGMSGSNSTLSNISAAAKPGLYAGLGASIGGAFAPNNPSPLPSGFNTPLPAVQPTLAHGNGTTTPQFSNYNPYQAVTGGNAGYNFFPAQGQSQIG